MKKVLILLIVISIGLIWIHSRPIGPNIPKRNIPQDIPADVKQQIERLYSKEWKERSYAAIQLGEMGTRAVSAIPFLIGILGDCGWLPTSDPFDPGTEAEEALEKMGTFTRSSLIVALKDRNPTVRASAAALLEKVGDSTAVESLILLLKDRNSRVRENAASALGKIKDSRAVEPLIAVLKDKDLLLVRCNVAEALGEIRDPRAIEPLFTAMKIEDAMDMNLANAAAEALGKIGTPRAIKLLIAILKEDSIIQSSAASALGEAKNPCGVEPLIEALKHGDEYVRWESAVSLGEIGDARAVESLIIAMMKDEDSSAREWSAWALGEIGDARATEPLITAMIKDKDVYVRKSAAGALGMIKSRRVVEVLIATLEAKKDSDIQPEVAKALGKTKNPNAIEPLIIALGRSDISLQISAEDALKAITTKNFGRDPAKWQEWWNKNKQNFLK